MKKISAILALTLILGLTGCKDDSYKSVRHPENDQEEMVNPNGDSGNKVEETGETQNEEDMTNEVREEITDGVEIKVEDKIKQLKIYKGDNIEKDVDTFCNENNLEWESKEQILSAIKDKM